MSKGASSRAEPGPKEMIQWEPIIINKHDYVNRTWVIISFTPDITDEKDTEYRESFPHLLLSLSPFFYFSLPLCLLAFYDQNSSLFSVTHQYRCMFLLSCSTDNSSHSSGFLHRTRRKYPSQVLLVKWLHRKSFQFWKVWKSFEKLKYECNEHYNSQ